MKTKMESSTIEDIDKNTLFELIDDPLSFTGEETVSWKGKLTPIFYCKPEHMIDESDEYSIDMFLAQDYVNHTLLSGKEELVEAFLDLLNLWLTSPIQKNKHFGFINVHKKTITKDLSQATTEAFGTGKKRLIYSAEIENPKQEEREPLKRHKYDKWIEIIYEMMGAEHQFKDMDPLSCYPETLSKTPFYRNMGMWVAEFYTQVAKRNVGVVINQVENFYSRLSGAYNTSIGSKTTHSFIAAIPLKISLKQFGENVRYTTEIAFRGPHHTRSPTDKTNLLIIEKLSDIVELPKNFYKNPTIIKLRNGENI